MYMKIMKIKPKKLGKKTKKKRGTVAVGRYSSKKN